MFTSKNKMRIFLETFQREGQKLFKKIAEIRISPLVLTKL
jgi:hypothetical protein